MEPRPHRWRYLNGFHIACTCGWRSSGWTMGSLQRQGNRHVQVASEHDLKMAQIREIGDRAKRERERGWLADAWDEGYLAGARDEAYEMERADNPYRSERLPHEEPR